jgi:hypothetical protein
MPSRKRDNLTEPERHEQNDSTDASHLLAAPSSAVREEVGTWPASNREAMSRASRSVTGKPATSHSASLEQVLFVRHVDAHASKLTCTKTSQ